MIYNFLILHIFWACRIVQWEAEVRPVYQAENTSLLRALRLSQSRAREAEKKAAAACKSKEQMSSFLMDESIRLSTHKRWVRLLETQILLLGEKKRLIAREEEGDGFSTLTWCLTLALCLGMGFSLGRYVFWSSMLCDTSYDTVYEMYCKYIVEMSESEYTLWFELSSMIGNYLHFIDIWPLSRTSWVLSLGARGSCLVSWGSETGMMVYLSYLIVGYRNFFWY